MEKSLLSPATEKVNKVSMEKRQLGFLWLHDSEFLIAKQGWPPGKSCNFIASVYPP